MGLKSFARSIWGSIRNKVVNAGSAVVGAAKSVKKRVGSVVGKAEDIKAEEELQEVINACVRDLNFIIFKNKDAVKDKATLLNKDKATLLNDVLKAFRGMMGTDQFKNFCRGCGSAKKGFAGFARLLSDYIGKDSNPMKGVESINKSNVEGKVGDTVLRVLSKVKRYNGSGSRVSAFVGPCNALYIHASGIGGSGDGGFGNSKDGEFGSYFDKACDRLSWAATLSREDEDEDEDEDDLDKDKDESISGAFCELMCDAYDAVCKMCRFETFGEKAREAGGSKLTASGRWYSKYGEDKIKEEDDDDKVRAVLAICDDEYKSDRRFVKRFLKFKGQTKWQKLQALVAKAKKNGMKIGVVGKNGELIEKDNNLEDMINLNLNSGEGN